jgi:hypothetical protein
MERVSRISMNLGFHNIDYRKLITCAPRRWRRRSQWATSRSASVLISVDFFRNAVTAPAATAAPMKRRDFFVMFVLPTNNFSAIFVPRDRVSGSFGVGSLGGVFGKNRSTGLGGNSVHAWYVDESENSARAPGPGRWPGPQIFPSTIVSPPARPALPKLNSNWYFYQPVADRSIRHTLPVFSKDRQSLRVASSLSVQFDDGTCELICWF